MFFDNPDSSAISSTKVLLNDRSFQKNIYMLEIHFNCLFSGNTNVEPKNPLLNDAVCETNKVQMYASVDFEYAEGEKVRDKLSFILIKNVDLKNVKK